MVVNQQLVVNGDVGKVSELINKCQTDLNLVGSYNKQHLSLNSLIVFFYFVL